MQTACQRIWQALAFAARAGRLLQSWKLTLLLHRKCRGKLRIQHHVAWITS